MKADNDQLKNAAALHAVDYVQDGFLLGLGSGSTAEFALHHLATRIASGLRILAVPTSHRTAQLARRLNIPLTTLEHHPRLDLTIDGADEVLLPSLNAIKGLGGALLREKIVALASQLVIFIVDETKVVHSLGQRTPVPVEVVTFGWSTACAALQQLGCETNRRLDKAGETYQTDSGNYLIDCKFPVIHDPSALSSSIKAITGVVEHGIFAGIASRIVIATREGIKVVEAPSGIMNVEL